MKIERIDLFTFPHTQQYGVQHAFTEGLQKALLRLGVASSLYDYKELSVGSVIAHLVQNSPNFTAGFNVTVSEHSPLEPLGIPHLAMIIDSANYFPELLRTPKSPVSFVDEDSIGFYKMLGGQNAFYFPHAIDRDSIREIPAYRDLDIVMCGSFMDAPDIAATWQELLSPESAARMHAMAERVLASSHISHLQAFVEEVNAKGAFEKELLEKGIDFFDLLTSLDQYIRGIDRIRILSAIERPIHVFGSEKYVDSWKKSVKNSSKLVFHDEVPYTDIQAIFRRSRIIINSFPMFKRGLHERLLLALGSGASVLANDNIAVQKVFGGSPALLSYLGYDKVNTLIDEALADEEVRLARVWATHPILLKEHTWDVRAQELLRQLSLLSL